VPIAASRLDERRPRHVSAAPALRVAIALALAVLAAGARGAQENAAEGPTAYKRMSLAELMDVEVTSVSRRAEPLSGAASALQVLTSEDIRRSGATSLTEALRLAANLQLARVNASQWAISARGFDNVLANKLLVLIDGRAVYTPLYAGVSWDIQDTLLEDVDRIEVISGPGGTLWGSNAVNGVINVITKDAKDTMGGLVAAGAGTELDHLVAARHGGAVRLGAGRTGHYRAWAKSMERDGTLRLDGADADDGWGMDRAGARFDATLQGSGHLTLQGDFYDGDPNPDALVPTQVHGGNVLSRWSRKLSDRLDVQVQAYWDHVFRDFGNGLQEELDTRDVEIQQRAHLARHELVWGADVRFATHDMRNLPAFGFDPARRTLQLFSAYVQDDVSVVEDRLRLTVGTKLEHHTYSRLDAQPSVRLAWTPRPRHLVWAAVSRAVRMPARIDRDFFLLAAPGVPVILGSGDFEAETLLEWEAGWRWSGKAATFSAVAFQAAHGRVRSAEPGPPPSGLPITFGNGVEGESWGLELLATRQVTDRWRLRGGLTLLRKHLRLAEGSEDLNGASAESNDPRWQALVQSSVDIPRGVEWDMLARWVDALPDPAVASHLDLDVRLGWNVTPRFELEIVGRDLVQRRHPEFVPSSPSPREIERSVHGRITWRF
jgi:iron complex outermembrane receptor protein